MKARFKLRCGYDATVFGHIWPGRTDFAYLGEIRFPSGGVRGWAWHEDGRSIDRDDRSFDLMDFCWSWMMKSRPTPHDLSVFIGG